MHTNGNVDFELHATAVEQKPLVATKSKTTCQPLAADLIIVSVNTPLSQVPPPKNGFITEISLKFQRWIFARVQNHLPCFCEAFPFCCWRSSLRHPFSPAAAMRNAGRHSRSAQRSSLFPSSLPQARKQYWAWAQANQLHGWGKMRQGGGWADTTEPCWKNGAPSTCCAEASNHIFNARGCIARKWSPWLFVVVVVLFYFGINLVYSDAFFCISLMSHLAAWALNLTCLKNHCSIPFRTPSSL